MKLISENEKQVVTGRDLSLLTLILIIIFAFVLRVYKANVMDLWLDDAFTYWLSMQSVPGIIANMYSVDAHPPLFYFFLHWWASFVPGEPLFLRLPGILFGTFSIIGVYLLAKELLGRQAALIAAFLTAVSGSQVAMCHQIRMYAPLSFFVIFAFYFFVKLFNKESVESRVESRESENTSDEQRATSNERRATSNERRATSDEQRATSDGIYWIAYTLFMVIAWYLHYGAIFVTVTHNIIVLLFHRRINIKYWIYSQAAILICYIPWYKYLFFQIQSGRGPAGMPFSWDAIFVILNCNFTTMLITFPTKVLFAVVCLGTSAVLVLAVANNYKDKFFLSIAFIGFFGQIAIFYFKSLLTPQSIFQTRYFYYILPLYIIIIVSAFMKNKKIQVFSASIILCAFLSFNLMGLDNYYRGITGQRWTEATNHLKQYYQKNDGIIIQSSYQTFLFNYYFRIPHEEYLISESELPQLRDITAKHKRIWLVRSFSWQGDKENKIYKWMMDNCRLIQAARYQNIIQSDADVIVMLFERRQGIGD